jgi:hypothetical protein
MPAFPAELLVIDKLPDKFNADELLFATLKVVALPLLVTVRFPVIVVVELLYAKYSDDDPELVTVSPDEKLSLFPFPRIKTLLPVFLRVQLPEKVFPPVPES